MVRTLSTAVLKSVKIWSRWRIVASNIFFLGLLISFQISVDRVIQARVESDPELAFVMMILSSVVFQLIFAVVVAMVGFFNFQAYRNEDFDIFDLVVSTIFFFLYLMVVALFVVGVVWIVPVKLGFEASLVVGASVAFVMLLFTLGGVAQMVYAGSDYGKVLESFIAIFSPKRIWSDIGRLGYWKRVVVFTLFALGLWIAVALIGYGLVSAWEHFSKWYWLFLLVKAVVDVTFYAALFFGLEIFIQKESK